MSYADKMKEKIKVKCVDCGTEFDVTYGWFKRVSSNHEWRCKVCRIEYSKSWFDRKSPEEKAKVSENMSKSAKNRWDNMTPEEYDHLCKSLSEGDRNYWDNLDNKSYKKRCQASQDSWDNRTKEQRKLHSENTSKGQSLNWKRLKEENPEKYKERCKQLKFIAQYQWDTMTVDNFRKRQLTMSETAQNFWDNMTPEKYAEWDKSRADGFNEYLNNLKFNPNKNELKVINYLNLYNIKWNYQYFNDTIHSDFHNLFPVNPVFNTTHINPFHLWDFKLDFKNNKSILVDVDGSIHDPDKTNYEVTYYTGEKFILSDYIQFNDSQRLYQRDDMDAYIIKSYNDNVTLDSIVVNLVTNESMSLKVFLDMLSAFNLSDDELSNIINY